MAIRTNTNPREMDLQPEMQKILMRNGMQAHVVSDSSGYRLVVQGHDSPLLTYAITERQMLALTDWGTNTANKKAYNVFTSIVGNDFYLPKNFVHARNANGRVAMGLHGYRIGLGEYGRTAWPHMPPPFLGWTPRNQWGFHLRRVGGDLFYPGGPAVPERWDGRMKPGELQSGGYGFYYKGNRQAAPQQERDVLQDLQAVITPMTSRPRSTEPAIPYRELITSPVYFSNEKWQECLSSHGIIIDQDAKTMTIQSERETVDMVYDLSEEETAILTSNSIEEHPTEKRISLINDIISPDFADKVSMETLNSNSRIAIGLHPEIRQEIEQENQLQENTFLQEQQVQEQRMTTDVQAAATVDGRDLTPLNEKMGWYREERNGREVEVGEIAVHPAETEGKFRMSAVINGQVVSHEISQKQYDKFLAVDDYHRMKLFSKVFDEVDMKMRPEARQGLGVKILAALSAGTVVASEVAHNLRCHHAPEVYTDHYCGPRPYYKPGVDTPRDVAIRYFEAEMNREITDMRLGR